MGARLPRAGEGCSSVLCLGGRLESLGATAIRCNSGTRVSLIKLLFTTSALPLYSSVVSVSMEEVQVYSRADNDNLNMLGLIVGSAFN